MKILYKDYIKYLPASIDVDADDFHIVPLGSTFKILFAQGANFYEFSLLDSTLSRISIGIALEPTSKLVKVYLSPDHRYIAAFFHPGFILLFAYETGYDMTSGYKGLFNRYGFLQKIPILNVNSIYFTHDRYGYYLKISCGGTLQRIFLTKKTKMKAFIDVLTNSEVLLSESDNYKVTLVSDVEKATIKIYEDYNVFPTESFCIQLTNPQRVRAFFIDSVACVFYTEFSYCVYNLEKRSTSEYNFDDMTIREIVFNPRFENIIIFFENDTCRIHNIKNEKSIVRENCRYGNLLTENIVVLINKDIGRSYLCSYIKLDLAEQVLPINSWLHSQKLPRHENSSCLWVDMLDWPVRHGVLLLRHFDEINALARQNRFEVNHPGYAKGMEDAYSHAIQQVNSGKNLSFDILMELHEKLMTPIQFDKVELGFTTDVAWVKERHSQLHPLTTSRFLELIIDPYSNIEVDKQIIKLSKKEISFTISVENDAIFIYGIDPKHNRIEAARKEINHIISNFYAKNMSKKSTKDTIGYIVILLLQIHPFHLVRDGSGRLILLALFYLLYQFKLTPSILVSCSIFTIHDLATTISYVKKGQEIFKDMCKQNYAEIYSFIEEEQRKAMVFSELISEPVEGEISTKVARELIKENSSKWNV